MKQRDKKINHILVMRLSAMGDIALTVPVIAGLRKAYPSLRVTYLTSPALQTLFRGVDGMEFLDYEPSGRHKGLSGLVRFIGDIRRTGADAVADLHGSWQTMVARWLLFLSGVKVAKVDSGREERKELTRRTRKKLMPVTSVPERYRAAFEKLGLDFQLDANGQRTIYRMPELIAKAAGPKSGVWIGVAPFARHKGKIYPIPQTDELIGLLSKKYDKVFIFGGGSQEKSFAEGMEIRHEGVVSVIGNVGLAAELDVMSNLDAMVTMDSASMHLAATVGVPVVSIWGSTHPYAGFYGWGQDFDDAVQLDMACRPCSVQGNKLCIFGDYRCLTEITPQTIVDAVERRVLKNRKRSSPAGARSLRAKAAESESPELSFPDL